MKRKGIEKPIMHWSVIEPLLNHIRTGLKGATYEVMLTEKYHILTSPINLINKGPSFFQNAAKKTSFTSLIIKQSHWIIDN